jgi:translation initiation factor IF-3
MIKLHLGDKMEVITLDQAKKIAEKRNMKLVNIIDRDTKSSRPIYKLMTSHEYHAEELKKREEKKEARGHPQIKAEKLLTINNKISQHDLESKVGKVKKWIEKMHEIRVVVGGEEGNMGGAEKITKTIEEAAKELEARVLQKRTKDNTIRFTLMPNVKKEKEKASTAPHKKEFLEPENLNIQQARSYAI